MSSGKLAHPRRVTSQHAPSTPLHFPRSNPKKMPTLIGWSSVSAEIVMNEMPAFARANTGITTKDTRGYNAYSKRCNGVSAA
jgi:hypothetical protein